MRCHIQYILDYLSFFYKETRQSIIPLSQNKRMLKPNAVADFSPWHAVTAKQPTLYYYY